MSPLYEFLILFCCHLIILLLVAAGDGNAESHRGGGGGGGECPASFDCGPIIGDISFPFTTAERRDCGLLPIQNCHDPLKPRMIQLQNNGKRFLVIRKTKISPTPTSASIQIRDNDFYKLLQSKSCEAFGKNYTFPPTFHFGSFSMEFTATLFRCNRALNVSASTHMFSYTNCSDYVLYYNPSVSEEYQSSLAACTKVLLPIKDVADANDPFTFIAADFVIQVHLSEECANCHYKKRGQCQLDSQSKFYCANGKKPDPFNFHSGFVSKYLLSCLSIYNISFKKTK